MADPDVRAIYEEIALLEKRPEGFGPAFKLLRINLRDGIDFLFTSSSFEAVDLPGIIEVVVEDVEGRSHCYQGVDKG